MRGARPLVIAAFLVLVACGDESDGVFDPEGATTPPSAATTEPPATTTTTAPSRASTTTAAPATTGSTAPPSTTTIPPPTYTAAVDGFFPDPLGTPAAGHGSGCVIDGDVLTDGMWFGFVDAVGGGSATFDLACFFTGPAAVAAATADGAEAFDFYIRNMNPKTFSVPLDAAGTAYWLDATGDLTPLALPMTSWPMPHPPSYQECPGDFCAAWVYVNGGVATELIEQYLP